MVSLDMADGVPTQSNEVVVQLMGCTAADSGVISKSSKLRFVLNPFYEFGPCCTPAMQLVGFDGAPKGMFALRSSTEDADALGVVLRYSVAGSCESGQKSESSRLANYLRCVPSRPGWTQPVSTLTPLGLRGCLQHWRGRDRCVRQRLADPHRCAVRDSNSGHQLLLPPAKWCPIFAPRTTQARPASSWPGWCRAKSPHCQSAAPPPALIGAVIGGPNRTAERGGSLTAARQVRRARDGASVEVTREVPLRAPVLPGQDADHSVQHIGLLQV